MSLYAQAFTETCTMVFGAGALAFVLGLPIGFLLFSTNQPLLKPHKMLYFCLSTLINILRSIPFIILMIVLIPITRFLIGTSIGTAASLIPLTVCAIPFFARLIEESLQSLQQGLIDAGLAMGCSTWQLLYKILLPEIRLNIVSHITTMLVNLIGYSAMAGALGGGGLGSLAIHYGYQRFDTTVMIITVMILIVLVQSIQFIGDHIRLQLEKSYHL